MADCLNTLENTLQQKRLSQVTIDYRYDIFLNGFHLSHRYNAYFKLLTCIIILDAGGCRVMIGLLENVMPVSSSLNLVPTHSYTPIFMPSLKHFELLQPKQ